MYKLQFIGIFDTLIHKGNGPSSSPPTPPSMYFDALSLRSYRSVSANVGTYVSATHSLVKLSVCLSLSFQLHTSAFHLSCTGKAELVGGHGHRGGGWVQTWYFQPCGNFSSWLELCTNPCGGYRLRLLGTQRSAQPKFCQLETFICIFGQCEESWNF